MKIIVTGGAGFIGSNFIYYMMEKHSEDQIICLDALTYAGHMSTLEVAMKNPAFRFVKASVTDRVDTFTGGVVHDPNVFPPFHWLSFFF